MTDLGQRDDFDQLRRIALVHVVSGETSMEAGMECHRKMHAILDSRSLGQREPVGEALDRQMLEAEVVRRAILDLQRERGRLSKVTVGDYLIVLGGVRQISDAALRAAANPERETQNEEDGQDG